METVTAYLESASINGLAHIAATKKLDRLYWILIVLSSFIMSIYLIVEMYIFWAENPIRTDVDTLPMTEVRFPKVTVCPPRGTFTDLNYDIKHAEGKNLTLKEREELNKYARDTIESISFMENLNQMQEKDRFYNWYHAITSIEGSENFDEENIYTIQTMATSGVITSHFFKNLFFQKTVERKIEVFPPKTFFGSEQNLRLHFHLEKVSVPGIEDSADCFFFPDGNRGKCLDYEQDTAYSTFTTKANSWDIGSFNMNLELDDVDISELEKMEQMPGFNFSWWYTGGNMEPGNIYTEKCKDDWNCQDPDDLPIYKIYKEFVRDGVFWL